MSTFGVAADSACPPIHWMEAANISVALTSSEDGSYLVSVENISPTDTPITVRVIDPNGPKELLWEGQLP